MNYLRDELYDFLQSTGVIDDSTGYFLGLQIRPIYGMTYKGEKVLTVMPDDSRGMLRSFAEAIW